MTARARCAIAVDRDERRLPLSSHSARRFVRRARIVPRQLPTDRNSLPQQPLDRSIDRSIPLRPSIQEYSHRDDYARTNEKRASQERRVAHPSAQQR